MLQYRVVRNVRKVASKMPCHPINETGKEVPCPNGTTSNFGKHTTARSQWIDIWIETLEDMPMTASELKEKIALNLELMAATLKIRRLVIFFQECEKKA